MVKNKAMEEQIIIFDKEAYVLHIEKHPITQQNAMYLRTLEGEPQMTITKNVEHLELEEDEVVIKDYSENEGIMAILIRRGIIAKPHEKIKSGHDILHICQLIH